MNEKTEVLAQLWAAAGAMGSLNRIAYFCVVAFYQVNRRPADPPHCSLVGLLLGLVTSSIMLIIRKILIISAHVVTEII